MRFHFTFWALLAFFLSSLAVLPAAAASRLLDCRVAVYSGNPNPTYLDDLVIQVDYDSARRAALVSDRYIEKQYGVPIPASLTLLAAREFEVEWHTLKPIGFEREGGISRLKLILKETSGAFILHVLMDRGTARGEGTCKTRAKPLT